MAFMCFWGSCLLSEFYFFISYYEVVVGAGWISAATFIYMSLALLYDGMVVTSAEVGVDIVGALDGDSSGHWGEVYGLSCLSSYAVPLLLFRRCGV